MIKRLCFDSYPFWEKETQEINKNKKQNKRKNVNVYQRNDE